MTNTGLSVHIKGTGAFSLEKGVMGLIGLSGSGKTTLAEQIAGLRDNIQGTIHLNNQCVFNSDTSINVPAAKRHVGFMFQDKLLFPHLTIFENITFPLKMKRRSTSKVQQIISELDLSHITDKYPHQTSGGEKQRVCLARAIISSPELLILDEPTTGLDPRRRDMVIQLLRKTIKNIGCPTLLITHHIDDMIELCDTLAVMSEQRIIASGNLSDVLALPEVQPFLGYKEIITEIAGSVISENNEMVELRSGSIILNLENDPTLEKNRRLRIRARDVAIALEKPKQTSIQNIIAGKIIKLEDHGPSEALVSVALGEGQEISIVKSLITQKSKRALRLTTGLNIFVMIKAVAMQNSY